ncbi:hypothetical protein SIN07_02075 [Pediococcus inopinatus]|uniref:LXG domain-containing protein n=1 Tax=Pediococcus inopinatus TaxID=114090 RepID=A0ABZ0Q384_9LACO|nr:hypothetical protein [Pediococcus inopinatus]AVL00497.1 hypothetical protein PI20285_07510 [Pediococcus inopinatus]KRN62013.1 hypothetical protein IV83_GL000430 [Pediococcus inopinatus]WPC18152.1 hypothetical protein N6G94_03870 [Pediococcus inopinatus]WPC19695.1 hypothetical protein N6G95_00380 [Pediococcus inopinatus]WPC21391.1 hypothetical protein N6G96_08955 [Pediococcus inopinatus]
MRKVNPQGYVNLIGKVMDSTEEMGGQVDPYFQNLKKTQALKGIDSLGERDLHEIVSNFKEAVDLYQKNAQTLKNAKPPVQVLGRHKQFVSAYQTYADDCAKMLESIDEENRSLDSAAFAQSEQDQDKDTDAVSKSFERIMNLMVG